MTLKDTASKSEQSSHQSIAQTTLGGWRRSHNLGELSEHNDGQTVTVMGWVHRRRDLGNLIFLDLRDRFGLAQVVLDPNDDEEIASLGNGLRQEYVIAVQGSVRKRPEGMVNKTLPSGAIEVHAQALRVLGPAQPLPFPVAEDGDLEANETLRLKHRYLDLRRSVIQSKIIGRSKLVRCLRNAMETRNFLDIETPFLYKSTPEGAREFLAPSRLHPGKFYALPQSPQLFKQMLMVAGFDRYYQLVRCFRDEDLRADRQPEFTQMDCEMSFVEQEEVLETFEAVVKEAVAEFSGVTFTHDWDRLTFAECMESYGVDKPDLRFGLKLVDLKDQVIDCGFRVFVPML